MNNKLFNVLGVKVDVVQIPDVIRLMGEWIHSKGCQCNYICQTNVSTIVEAQRDLLLKDALNNATLSVCDGMPLVWLGRLKGLKLKRRVYGPELMERFLKVSNEKGYKNYFYGATDSVCQKLISQIRSRYKELDVVGYYAPPFRSLRPEEKVEIAKKINDSGADVLWVAVGSPKQEMWMYEFKDRLQIPVMVGVGAAFDFLAGTKPQAPLWLRETGFEWFFRLSSEPKRLWKRYLISNSLFILGLIREFFQNKLWKEKSVL